MFRKGAKGGKRGMAGMGGQGESCGFEESRCQLTAQPFHKMPGGWTPNTLSDPIRSGLSV